MHVGGPPAWCGLLPPPPLHLCAQTLLPPWCLPAVAQTKDFAGADVESQTEQVMKNLEAVLAAAGSSMSKVVKASRRSQGGGGR